MPGPHPRPSRSRMLLARPAARQAVAARIAWPAPLLPPSHQRPARVGGRHVDSEHSRAQGPHRRLRPGGGLWQPEPARGQRRAPVAEAVGRLLPTSPAGLSESGRLGGVAPAWRSSGDRRAMTASHLADSQAWKHDAALRLTAVAAQPPPANLNMPPECRPVHVPPTVTPETVMPAGPKSMKKSAKWWLMRNVSQKIGRIGTIFFGV